MKVSVELRAEKPRVLRTWTQLVIAGLERLNRREKSPALDPTRDLHAALVQIVNGAPVSRASFAVTSFHGRDRKSSYRAQKYHVHRDISQFGSQQLLSFARIFSIRDAITLLLSTTDSIGYDSFIPPD